jgi:hypothetical protein
MPSFNPRTPCSTLNVAGEPVDYAVVLGSKDKLSDVAPRVSASLNVNG